MRQRNNNYSLFFIQLDCNLNHCFCSKVSSRRISREETRQRQRRELEEKHVQKKLNCDKKQTNMALDIAGQMLPLWWPRSLLLPFIFKVRLNHQKREWAEVEQDTHEFT